MRVYVLKYDMILASGKTEEGKEQFFTDKGDFIKEYLRLKEAWYCVNLTAYRAVTMQEFDVDALLNF